MDFIGRDIGIGLGIEKTDQYFNERDNANSEPQLGATIHKLGVELLANQ